MERRDFLKTTAATATVLATQGSLPLLAADRKKRAAPVSQNCFTEPSAIEPVTGYLPKYTPATAGAMRGAFTARYSLIVCHGSAARSRNSESGEITVAIGKAQCKTTEKRKGKPANIVKTSVRCAGELNTAPEWTLESTIEGTQDLGFVEDGTWDGKVMRVKARSWTQQHATKHPLIARWSLLPLVASGRFKKKPLTFDMLDDSTLRPNQELRYEGEITIPVKGGTATLDSYAQTGESIVPTHYLVDDEGRVQLITMSYTNWALQGVQG